MANSISFVDTKSVFIRQINASTAKELIVKNHYSHSWTMCSVALGVFIKDKIKGSSFFENDDEQLIGVIVYGTPVGRKAAESISPQLKHNQVLELVRLWIKDIPNAKNIESYCIGQSFDWLRKNIPNVKALISYADNEAGHTGIIYQSTNWIYQGNSQLKLMPNYSVSLTSTEEGGYKWIHSRTVFSRYKTTNTEALKKLIGKDFYVKKESTKHRYIYILSKGKERKRLIKSLKHPSYPYPKRDEYQENIQHIVVTENDISTLVDSYYADFDSE
jgi:hypothetical protein